MSFAATRTGHRIHRTERTQPRWQVLCPEVLETYWMGDEGNQDFDLWKSFFSKDMGFDVWGALARPVSPVSPPNNIVSEENGKPDDDYPWRKSLGIFDLISNELVDMVIERVSDLGERDLIALGLTCQGFWDLVVHRIQTDYIKKAAPWAGKKLALMGSLSKSVPPPFEENDLAVKIMQDAKCKVSQHAARSLFCFMQGKGARIKTPRIREANAFNSIDELLPVSKIPQWRWGEMREQLTCPDLFPSDREWVLRNLTTKEYISWTFNVGMIRATKIRFVDALLSQICWTDVPWPVWAPPGQEVLAQGEWAGHCFDVVTKDMLMIKGEFEPWKDVTDKVAQKARLLQRR